MISKIWQWILSIFNKSPEKESEMFNEAKWQELISALISLPINSSGYFEIYTKSKEQLNLIKITSNLILVATKKDWNKFNEIPRDMVETTYNELLKKGKLTQNDISKG